MKNRPSRIAWGLAAWMLLIFVTSSFFVDLRDFIHIMQSSTSDPRVKGAIADFWLHNAFYVVKSWHATEYAILTTLCAVALRQLRGWPAKPTILAAFIFAVLFAISDEWHQTFVQYRNGCVRDVLIDSTGALFAGILLAVNARRTQRAIE